MNLHITTPFGRRSLTAAQIHAQANAAACPYDAVVDKWAVFRHVALCKDKLGLSDRALAVLNALLTFHPETVLGAGEGAPVVFPSNAALALRAHGMAETTLRRHLSALVEAGLVIRRDSPNGKRYARKGQGGEIAQAFGFDLSALVARAPEFARMAETIEAERRALRLSREQLTLVRRDLVKAIEAVGEGDGEAAAALRDAYARIVSQIPRVPDPVILRALNAELMALAIEAGKILCSLHDPGESDGSADHSERHNQSSNPKTPDLEKAAENEEEGEGRAPLEPAAISSHHTLADVLEACPDILDYTRDGIRSWGDLISVADLVRSMLGISPSAWREAVDVMGPQMAAITVAAILQRAEHIKSPGGYLRALVERRRGGQFSLTPVLQALSRARLRALPHEPATRPRIV